MNTQRVVVLRADDDPRPGVVDPTTNDRYRHPAVRVEERPLGPLAAGAVRVRMDHVGVCGSDLHLCQAGADGYVRSSVPARIDGAGRVLGHEGTGTVLDVGAGVEGVAAGDVVAFASIAVCGSCDACAGGAPNQCRHAVLLGAERDGLFGTVVDVAASLAVVVTHLATTDAARLDLACLEPAANALVACDRAGVGANDRVVVFGAGPMGLYTAMLCRVRFGARRIVVVEPLAARREVARQWSDAVLDVAGFAATDDRFDVAVEASGDLSNATDVVPRLDPRGRLVLLGRGGEPLTVDRVDHLISQSITIVGSRGHLGGAIDEVLDLYASGRLPLGAVVTDVLTSLDDLAALLGSDQAAMDEQAKVVVRLR